MYLLSSLSRSVGSLSWMFCFYSCLLLSAFAATDGDLDPSFGDSGKLVFIGDFAATDEFLDVCLEPNGAILGIGYTSAGVGFGWDVTVARFNGDGSFDTTFGSGGRVSYDFGADEFARAGVRLDDGKYFIVGERWISGQSDILLLRIQSDGALDTSFGAGGVLALSGGHAADVLQLPDGRVVIGATVNAFADDDFALICLQASGSVDTGFGGGGYLKVDFGSQDQLARLALTLDGRILAAGLSGSGNLLVAMVGSTGALDPGFGSGGKAVLGSLALGDPVGGRSSVGLAVQLDGKVVVGSGLKEDDSLLEIPDSDLILVRLNPDGTLDSSFGTGGVSRPDMSGFDDVLADLLIQPDGRIVAVGTVFPVHYGDFLVQRYNPDGSPDLSFGTNGWVATDFAWDDRDGARSVLMQPDGRILVSGHGPDLGADAWDMALARYLSSVDRAGALAVLRASLETIEAPHEDLLNLLENAAIHMDRQQWRPAQNTLSALEQHVGVLDALEPLGPEYRRRLLEIISAIKLGMPDVETKRTIYSRSPRPNRIPDGVSYGVSG